MTKANIDVGMHGGGIMERLNAVEVKRAPKMTKKARAKTKTKRAARADLNQPISKNGQSSISQSNVGQAVKASGHFISTRQATKTPMTPSPTTPPPSTAQPPPGSESKARPRLSQKEAFKEVIRRANNGDLAMLEGMREILDKNEHFWSEPGNLANLSKSVLLDRISHGDHFVEEATKRWMARARADLTSTANTPPELMLVDLVISTWLEVRLAEIHIADVRQNSIQVSNLRLKQLESATRRHLQAIKALSMVRKPKPEKSPPSNSRVKEPHGES